MSELPDWLTVGAKVVEHKRGAYTLRTVKRITDTLVMLDNGSRYHRVGSGYRRDGLCKTGERNKQFYGSDGPTVLMSAEDARTRKARSVIRKAAEAASRATSDVTERGASADVALDQIQEAIDRAREELARIAREYGKEG